MFSKLPSLLIVLTSLVAGTIGAAAGTLDQILEKGKVRIAVVQDLSPWGFLNTNLQPEGFDIDVARLLAERLGVDLELVPTISANRIPFLQTDKVDIVIAALGANPDRAKSIWFSSAYALLYSGVFASKDINISSYADLAGKTVGVTRGNTEDLLISSLAPAGAKIMRFEDNATTISAWMTGQTEVLVNTNTTAAEIAKNNPDKNIESKLTIIRSPLYMGVTKGNDDLLRWINVFILHSKLNGDLNKITEKWFSEPMPSDLPTL